MEFKIEIHAGGVELLAMSGELRAIFTNIRLLAARSRVGNDGRRTTNDDFEE
jgi:hypothetical protein